MSEQPTDLPNAGDQATRLIQTHQTGVWRYLRSLGCNDHEAEDLTQETFLRVLQKPFDDFDRAATAAYLRRVAHNLLIDLRRRHKRLIVTDDVEKIDAFWQQVTVADQGEDVIAVLQECLASLSNRAQTALRMRFEKRKSRQEIADAIGVGEHGAKNLMQRAKSQLRECIERKLRLEDHLSTRKS
ncbi:RNA polymerase sigma factor [Blastopirellula marina]|uniref:RNA polymerase sigma factor n=1 Tax=Blastopirellula marina DSM 3645 TaxID=314230 RepID=A3ZMG5_9BACT|nr:sigma-70 family RNA polymerase sigma factor [Blastopirellula marina]EAQ82138.1 probable sigma-70 factor (ECF subfamily protein) [Blastopirellula marina DSM 3645]